MRLLVGLRNPGSDYEGSRHNVGGVTVARLVADAGGRLKRAPRFIRADVAEVRIDGTRVVLAVPRTFMNESGAAVAPLVRYFKAEPAELLVIHDDIDLPFAKLRVAEGGGAGCNNGVRSVIQSLANPDFWRLKIGVGRPPGRMDPADYVLRRFSKVEHPEIEDAIERACSVAATFVAEGGDAARQQAGASNID